MNIYLIHGDNKLASYERLQEYISKARSKGWEIITIDEKYTDIINALRSNSLFNQKKLVVIKKYTLFEEEAINYLHQIKDETEIVIYHDNNIPITFIKKIPAARKNEVYKLSKYLWKFIDNFYPGNSKNCLFYFHESIKNDPVELLFSLLVGQLRDMFLLLYSDNSLTYPSWRLENIKRQGARFGKEKIKMTIQYLADIDLKNKTTSSELKDELDLFILRKLE